MAQTSVETVETHTEAPYDYISFSDGDISLKSSDGVVFQVDSVVLRRASLILSSIVHEHLEKRPILRDSTQAAVTYSIDLDEQAYTIDVILRLMYPPYETSDVDTNIDRAVAVLQAVRKYQLPCDSPLGLAAVACVGDAEPPARAWCLAAETQKLAARNRAVRRFLSTSTSTGMSPSICELDAVTARQVVELLHLRTVAWSKARSEMRRFIENWFCPEHRGLEDLSRWLAGPFTHRAIIADDEVLDDLARDWSVCVEYRYPHSVKTSVLRSQCRTLDGELIGFNSAIARVQKNLCHIFEQAVESEVNGIPSP